MPKRYPPFNDKAHMLRSALADAISWEESRLDAGCHMGDAVEEQAINDRIKSYREELRRMNPNARTLSEVRDEELSKWKAIPITRILRDAKRKRLKKK